MRSCAKARAHPRDIALGLPVTQAGHVEGAEPNQLDHGRTNPPQSPQSAFCFSGTRTRPPTGRQLPGHAKVEALAQPPLLTFAAARVDCRHGDLPYLRPSQTLVAKNSSMKQPRRQQCLPAIIALHVELLRPLLHLQQHHRFHHRRLPSGPRCPAGGTSMLSPRSTLACLVNQRSDWVARAGAAVPSWRNTSRSTTSGGSGRERACMNGDHLTPRAQRINHRSSLRLRHQPLCQPSAGPAPLTPKLLRPSASSLPCPAVHR